MFAALHSKISNDMVVRLNSKSTEKEIQEALQKLQQDQSEKVLDASKFSGTVKFPEDGLVLQKRFRDEWK